METISQINNTGRIGEVRSPLLLDGQVLGHIISYLGEASDSICNLLVALYKYVHLVAPHVTQLNIRTWTYDRGCLLLNSNFLQQFINLQAISMSLSGGIVDQAVPLPMSTKYISYRSLESVAIVKLLGPKPRPNLTSLHISLQQGDVNFLWRNTQEFVYPNLSSLKIQLVDLTSPKALPYNLLYNLLADINSKSPNLESLSLSFWTSYCVNLGSNTTIDISFFAQLRKLKLNLKHWNHAWEGNFVLPRQLTSLSAPSKILNNILCDMPLPQLTKIRLVNGNNLTLPIERLAPNLQYLTCSKYVPLSRSSFQNMIPSFPKLESLRTIGGELLRWNPHWWPVLSQAIQNGMILDIEKVFDFVEIGPDHCEFVPPFSMIEVSGPRLVQKMPIPTLCRVESLFLHSPVLDDWMFLSKLPLNVVELNVSGIDIAQYFDESKVLVNFCPLVSLESFLLSVKFNCVGLQTLAHVKQLVENCLPSSLINLHLSHQKAELFFQDLCQYDVGMVRSNGISLVTLLQRLPNLERLKCDFPVMDIDEPGIQNVHLGRLTMLRITTWRGGSSSFDDTHVENLVTAFDKINTGLFLHIIQPAWTSRLPNSNKTFTAIDDVPRDLQRLVQIFAAWTYCTRLTFANDDFERNDDQDDSSSDKSSKNENQRLLYQKIHITKYAEAPFITS